jgi:hypothetical protein
LQSKLLHAIPAALAQPIVQNPVALAQVAQPKVQEPVALVQLKREDPVALMVQPKAQDPVALVQLIFAQRN